jgi:hypothetical protein
MSSEADRSTDDVRELSDDELLERIAGLDPDRYPLTDHVRKLLAAEDDQEGSS